MTEGNTLNISYGLLERTTDLMTNNDIKKLTIQEAVIEVGGFNRYQLRVFILFALQWAIATMLLVSGPVVFLRPSFLCNGESCTEDDGGCDAQIIDPSSIDSISKEFGLYCDQRAIRDVAESSVFFGALVGNFLFSLVSINRRSHLGFTWLVGSIGCLGLAFSPNIYVFIVFYVLGGFGCLTAIMVHFAIMSEQGVERFAQLGTLGCMIAWSVMEMFIALIVWELPHWRQSLLWFLGVPAFILNITYFLIFESPKFVYLKNKVEALKILNGIAKINGRPELLEDALEEREDEHIKMRLDQRKYTILDLFRYKSLRTPTLLLIFAHFFVEVFYWGTGFALPSLGTSIYLNILLFGIIELVSYIVAEICIRKFKRRISFIVIGAICTVLSIVFYFLKVPDDCSDTMCAVKVIKTILVMFARGLVCLSLTIMYVYFSEIFPTSVKAIGILITYAAGSVGSLSASYVVDYAQNFHIPPMLFLGILVGIQTVICFWLKETFGIERDEQIVELKSPNRSKNSNDMFVKV